MFNRSSYIKNLGYKRLRYLGASDANALGFSTSIVSSKFETGEVVWSKGANIDAWYFILSGMVVATLPTSEKGTVPIGIYGPNSWFGEQSILNRKPSYVDYQCLTAVEVLSVSAATVLELLECDVGFSSSVAKLMSWRAQHNSEVLMLMKLGSPSLRVVMGICQFAETLAYNADRPPTIGFGEGIEIPVKQEVIASLCGVSRSRLSTYLQVLASHGWLRIAYGGIEIIALEAWQRFSNLQRLRTFGRLEPTMDELLAELNACGPL